MSLNIKNPATGALADELARRQGISKTAAIHQALSERTAPYGLQCDSAGATARRTACYPRTGGTFT